jgi:quercetin dioxygenase-like cupin family protein
MVDTLETVLKMALPDRAIDSEKIPWVPQGNSGRVWFKPLRFDLTTGRWINLIRMTGQGQINRHRHSGGQVIGYCVQGSWHYKEKSWQANPGTLIWEPPGDIHTLIVDGAEGMTTLFIIEGTIQYIDDHDNVIYQDDIFTKMQYYSDYCKANGIEMLDLCF